LSSRNTRGVAHIQ